MSPQKLQRALVEAPRWLLLALLVFAPWAYGSTLDWAIDVLNRGMLLTLGLWLLGCVGRRLAPQVHPVLLGSAALLFLQGWWLIANVQTFYDRTEFRFVPVTALLSFAPGAIDLMDCVPAMVRVTGLLGIACFVCDLSQRREWRQRIWWTIGLCGGSVILFGLIERIFGAPTMFWENGQVGLNFFATYYYHGNAGAFINLVFPPIACLALVALRTRDANSGRAIWFPCLMMSLAGAFATASKAAIVITILLAFILVVWRFRLLADLWKNLPSNGLRVIVALALALGIFSLGWLGWDRMMERWTKEAWGTNSYDNRLFSYQASLKMLPDSGLWGFGPGNFSIAFPHYTNDFGDKLEGFWRFAHEDYLQTLIEWGWIGGASCAVIFFGGIFTGLRAYRRTAALFGTLDRTLWFATLLALFGVAIHATVDFPLQIASLQLYVAVYLGLMWGSSNWKTPRSGEGTTN